MSVSLPEIPSQLLASIYEAAEAPQRWPDVVATITQWLGGAAGALQARPSSPKHAPAMILSGLDPQFQHAYAEHHVQHDPYVARFAQLPVGETLLSRSVLPDRELLRSAYYNEFCRPQQLKDLQGIILLRNVHWVVSFAAMGSSDRTFDEHNLAKLAAVAPHLTRALRLGFCFDQHDLSVTELGAQLRVVDALYVDRSLRVLSTVGELTVLQHQEALLEITGHVLRARRPDQQRALEHAVSEALAGRSATLVLQGTAGQTLELGAAPGPRINPFEAQRCALLLLARRAAEHLERLDALPQSLRAVAEHMASGMSDKEIARALDLPLSTARTYVARAMKQLGITSRRQLMKRG